MRLNLFLLAILSVGLAGAVTAPGVAGEPDEEWVPPATIPLDDATQFEIPENLIVNGRLVGHRVETRAGEICIPCGKPVTQDDVTYRAEGQRVAVHKGVCLGALASQAAKWLSKLQPHGAFLDAASATAGVSSGWLVFGLYVLLGLIFSALAAHRAFSVGRDPLTWLAVGFVTSVFGYAVLCLLPRQEISAPAGVPSGLGKISLTYSPEACPKCGAENHPSARTCGGCGAGLSPRIISEVQRAGLASR